MVNKIGKRRNLLSYFDENSSDFGRETSGSFAGVSLMFCVALTEVPGESL